MTEMMIRGAIAQTIYDEMLRDSNVVMLGEDIVGGMGTEGCLLYTSPSPRDLSTSRMPSSA